MIQTSIDKFIQANSPDGGFLQSEEWQKFQEAVGRKIYNITNDNFYANIIEHNLPIVGKYFYIPRGPVVKGQGTRNKEQYKKLIDLAKTNNAGWIRIDPASEEILENIKKDGNLKIEKAPHDMQPRELFIIDVTKSEDQLLSEMKPKTRYNLRLAEKKGIVTRNVERGAHSERYFDEFLRLTRIMAKRQGILPHPDSYYRKMIETIPSDILKLYVAQYQGKVIVANLVAFFGETCIYLHGASDDEYRNVMAPFLLQWKQIQDAKGAGCKRYDFGGVSTNYKSNTNIQITNKWQGITKFKTGFSPNTLPTRFPGSYDIIINTKKYYLYRLIQKGKSILK